jgi:hypothetical protein
LIACRHDIKDETNFFGGGRTRLTDVGASYLTLRRYAPSCDPRVRDAYGLAKVMTRPLSLLQRLET